MALLSIKKPAPLIRIAARALFAGILLLPFAALAQAPTPPTTGIGAWISGIIGATAGLATNIPALLWFIMLVIVKLIVSSILIIQAFILDNIFFYAVVLNPSNMPAVQYAWGIMRDIANSFFILILLWIAFTIIFSIEHLGGRKFLVRIIIVALLINFSLAMVSAVFGFANAIAIPFRQALPRDLSGFITERVKLQLASNVSTGVPTMPASTSVDCGLAALINPSATGPGAQQGCINASSAVAYAAEAADAFLKGFLSTAILLKMSWTLAVTIFLFLLVIVAFIAAWATLLARIIAMVFLAILAPFAFLAFAIPNPTIMGWWNKWLNALLRWAFFAPAFYALFYVSLLILDAMTRGPITTMGTNSTLAGNLLLMLPLFVFVGFLWASITIGRKMGIAIGDTAVALAKTGAAVGLGYATGGASLAAAAAARRAAPAITKAQERLAQTPYLGKMAAPASRKVTGYLESQKQRVTEKRKGRENWSSQNLVTDFNQSTLAENKVAIAQILSERGDFSKLGGNQAQVLRLATQFGLQKDLLKARPDLATPDLVPDTRTREEAIRETARKMKPEEWAKMSLEGIKDPTTGALNMDVIRILVPNLDPEHIKRIARENPALREAFMNGIELEPQMVVNMKPETYRYLSSNYAQEMGLSLPENATPPTAVQREQVAEQRAEAGRIVAEEERAAQRETRETERAQERVEQEIGKRVEQLRDLEDQLKVLEERAGSLDQQNRQREAENIREVEVKKLEARIKNLRERLQ